MAQHVRRFGVLIAGLAALLAWTAACARDASEAPPPAPEAPQAPAAPASEEPYVPGLGEIMSLQQMRHAKLWFAGRAGNWDLAAYELDELGEGFEDAMKFHPTHKDAPVALTDVVPEMGTALLAGVRTAVEQHDSSAFERAFDALTAGCNNCHVATDFGFNRVQRPATNPYPNQQFEPAGR